MNLEEIQNRKQELRKLRETTIEQKRREFLEKWREVIDILKKTKSEFAEVTLENLNAGIAPQGKALELCNKLLEESLKPKPVRKPATKKTTKKTPHKTQAKKS